MADAYAREYESFFSGSIHDDRRSKLKGVLMVAAKRNGDEQTNEQCDNRQLCRVWEDFFFPWEQNKI